MANVNLPFPVEGKNDKETIQNLFDVVIRLRKELEFLLYNLDEENVLKAKYAEIANLVAGNISADQITTGTLDADLITVINLDATNIVSNTTIVNNLYAQYGRIANLTVNELNTSYKMIMNYLLKDTDFEASIADVVYRGIYDDRNEIWVCTTDGTEDEQVLGADDAPLYWTDSTKTQMHTEVTAYPVMQWVYDYVLKYEQGTELVDGVYLPYTIEGVGDGVTAMSGRLKTQKLSDGWHVTYYQRTTGVEIGFTVTDDGVKVLAPELNALTLKNCIISNQDPTVELLPVGDIWFKYT